MNLLNEPITLRTLLIIAVIALCVLVLGVMNVIYFLIVMTMLWGAVYVINKTFNDFF